MPRYHSVTTRWENPKCGCKWHVQAVRQDPLALGEEGPKESYLMGRVYLRPAARRDLIAHYCYLAENAGEVVPRANRHGHQNI
jgi:hypothetical protein